MKIAIEFSASPDVAEWATVLADDGWKITVLTATSIELEKVIGNTATYPSRQPLTWYLSVENAVNNSGVTVEIHVPAFADSVFSRQRLLDTIQEYAQSVNVECQADTSFELPLLEILRD